jgi:ATP-binding cassette subfamily F protein uup
VNYLDLERVTKSYGEKILFQDLSLQINRGEKIALVAKNGAGKSTLLRVIAGRESPEGEGARALMRRDVRVGYLEQAPEFFDQHTVLETVLAADTPAVRAVRRYERAMLHPEDDKEIEAAIAALDDLKGWDFEARVREILSRLSIHDLEQPVSALSGGQKKRLALAHLLIDEPEFLILDEPTNHLDLNMIEWLEEYLRQPNLTLLMVTHDRYFLERICDQILEIDQGKLYRYSGNYANFLEKKALRQEVESAEMEKARKLLRQELEWVNRTPQARTTKAKSRVDAYHELKDKVSGYHSGESMQIEIKGLRLGKKILEAHHLGKRFGELCIVEGFSYKFQKGERVGIVGPNGVGKSTFIKLLTGEIRPDTGKIVKGDNTVIGYYAQDGIQLAEDQRVIDVIRDIAEYIPLEKGQKLSAEQMLERFLFNRKQQQVYVSQLSGGERRRLFLLTVLMRNPNFLILDEPTNDLDIVTLNVLEEFLLDFPGCLLVVTHDRYFMDKIVDHLFVFEGKGVIKDFIGDYTAFRAYNLEQDRARRRQERAEERQRKDAQATNNKNSGPRLTPEERKEMKRLEKDIQKLEEKKREIHQQFTAPDLTPAQIERLSRELADIQRVLEEKEARWLVLAELA